MSVSKKGFLTTIKWVLIGVVFCITIISIFIMVYASQYDESYHSSYGLEDEFKTLQFYSNTRTALLKIGFSDTGLIVPWVEGQQQKIYEDGIKKITTLDAERLYWDYEFYIAPYKGEFLARDRISNNRQRLKQAINIITEYSKLNIMDKDSAQHNSFEHIAISFFFAYYDYPLLGFASWQDNKHITISAWNGFNKYISFYPMTKKDNIAIKSLFAMRLIDTVAGIIAYKWDDAKLACDDELVSVYQKLHENITDLTKPLINTLAKDDVPDDKLKKMNIYELSKYQVKAEKTLTEKCNLDLQNNK